MHLKKHGRRRGLQRYRCLSCGRLLQSQRRSDGKQKRLWNDYVWKKQTVRQLAKRNQRSIQWVRTRLDEAVPKPTIIIPQPTVVIADTTFWGRNYGVTVFRSPSLKKNLWWDEVKNERMATYCYGRKILEERGWTFTAAVVDGRRGLARVFEGVPVQICIFHQMKRVTTYLTRKPKTMAGVELRAIMLRLPRSTEQEFTALLHGWHSAWEIFISEKTCIVGTKHWYYTHKNVRGAYLSLKTNLPFLFTYHKHPELNIPTTTNSLDGMFTQLKAKISVHRGLRQDRRFRVISEILRGE